MCFSPEASFIASAGLSGIGVVSTRMSDAKGKMIALVPFLFALQQLSEGIQWLSLRSGTVNGLAGYVFVFFAFLFWPIYVPLTVYCMDEKKRHVIRFFLAAGVVVSFGLLYSLIFNPLYIQTFQKSILYTVTFPLSSSEMISFMGLILYLMATVGSLLASSLKGLRWMGLIIFAAFCVAWFVTTATYVSIWCFFAAILSALVVVYIFAYHRVHRGIALGRKNISAVTSIE